MRRTVSIFLTLILTVLAAYPVWAGRADCCCSCSGKSCPAEAAPAQTPDCHRAMAPENVMKHVCRHAPNAAVFYFDAVLPGDGWTPIAGEQRLPTAVASVPEPLPLPPDLPPPRPGSFS